MRQIRLNITDETYEELLALIRSRGWEEEDGLRILLGAGLGALRAAEFEAEEENGLPKNMAELAARLSRTESQLAYLRFRVMELEEDNRNWQLASGPIAQENEGLKAVARLRLEEIDRLKQEIEALRRRLNAD